MRRYNRPMDHSSSESRVELEAALENPADGDVNLAFPEGGRDAWVCLLGSCLMMFPSFGFQTAGKDGPYSF